MTANIQSMLSSWFKVFNLTKLLKYIPNYQQNYLSVLYYWQTIHMSINITLYWIFKQGWPKITILTFQTQVPAIGAKVPVMPQSRKKIQFHKIVTKAEMLSHKPYLWHQQNKNKIKYIADKYFGGNTPRSWLACNSKLIWPTYQNFTT